jgi:hypothetical protein
MMTGFLRSADRPSGWPLARLLREIRLELEGRILELPDYDAARGRLLQVAGHLLVAEGLESGAGAPLELVEHGDGRTRRPLPAR